MNVASRVSAVAGCDTLQGSPASQVSFLFLNGSWASEVVPTWLSWSSDSESLDMLITSGFGAGRLVASEINSGLTLCFEGSRLPEKDDRGEISLLQLIGLWDPSSEIRLELLEMSAEYDDILKIRELVD
ncbi:hypothetical protein L1987_12658 [Smallanthus sonchifolius]|uniref:Uncharacterized protein n=1 Tax=Smallanthus sonchifolius TaxID=185202 RepID=A0ACB9JFB7_9ASTR|nr:hypothetical protein L1987_12658 [Smallanthus sonchifolius]